MYEEGRCGRLGRLGPFGRCLLLLHLRLGQKDLWKKNRKHVDKQNDAVCGSSHAEIRVLYEPLGDAARGAMCAGVKSFQKSKRLKHAESHSLLFVNMSQLFSTCVHERR